MTTAAAYANRKLLVVDDEPLIRETLSLCLRDEYEVTAVASGEEAIEASLKEDFPVVILDLRMEGISGIETLRRLKKIREIQNIIILTAYESIESAIAALNLGAFNYLTKPFERAHLKEVISRGFEVYEEQTLRQKDMQQRLMSVHDTFFSMLCHEFNTPLNIILGFSELLMHSLKDTEHVGWAKDINDSGTHLHEILMEIVDYIGASHLAAAGVESEFVPRMLLQPLVPSFREKDVNVEFVHGPGFDGTLLGPSRSIFMIARKIVRMCSHQSKGIRVTMGLDAMDSAGNARLRLVVSPNATPEGFKPAELDKLFEPYQFAPSAQNGSRTSLGLELATCRKIAEYVKGTVDCSFKSDGRLDFIAEIPVKIARVK